MNFYVNSLAFQQGFLLICSVLARILAWILARILARNLGILQFYHVMEDANNKRFFISVEFVFLMFNLYMYLCVIDFQTLPEFCSNLTGKAIM